MLARPFGVLAHPLGVLARVLAMSLGVLAMPLGDLLCAFAMAFGSLLCTFLCARGALHCAFALALGTLAHPLGTLALTVGALALAVCALALSIGMIVVVAIVIVVAELELHVRELARDLRELALDLLLDPGLELGDLDLERGLERAIVVAAIAAIFVIPMEVERLVVIVAGHCRRRGAGEHETDHRREQSKTAHRILLAPQEPRDAAAVDTAVRFFRPVGRRPVGQSLDRELGPQAADPVVHGLAGLGRTDDPRVAAEV
jgi:hypothetical protein